MLPFATIFALACLLAAPARACGVVAIAQPLAPPERLAAKILEILLADAFACDVRIETGDPTTAIAAAARAARFIGPMRDPAASAPIVIPGAPPHDAAGAPELSVGGLLYGGDDRAGFFVPTWFAETRDGLRTLEDLRDGVDLFAPAGARPQLFVCPRDWACFDPAMAVVEALGLADGFEIVTPASGEALEEALADAQAARRPWIGFYWTPSAAAAVTPITPLAAGDLTIPSPDGGRTAPFDAAPLAIVYHSALDVIAPEAATALRAISLPLETHLETMRWRAFGGGTDEDAALWFLARNEMLWRSWLDPVAATRFAAQLRLRLDAAAGAVE